jgi:endogenous inhibitor of DNA gyrase (YacG/DUF329 family)
MAEGEKCPKCGASLGEVEETPSGKRLQRCTKGSYNRQTRQVEGCPYVKWLAIEPEALDEKCPTCGKPLELRTTRFGKKMKKCTGGGWDPETRKPTGCPYVEWIQGTTEALDEKCPKCGKSLVLFTTAKGKKLKKCSTAGWDREARKPTGCTYVEWLRGPAGEGSRDEIPPPSEGDFRG